MDYSTKIAEALTTDYITAEVHASTTHRARYRVYAFDSKGEMIKTVLVCLQRNGDITDENWTVYGNIKL